MDVSAVLRALLYAWYSTDKQSESSIEDQFRVCEPLAELRDLDVHVVTQDFDTRHESADILSAVNGAVLEHYHKEIGRRTRRGLEGRGSCGKAHRRKGLRLHRNAGLRDRKPRDPP